MRPGTHFTLIKNNKIIGSCYYKNGTTLSTIDRIKHIIRYYNKSLVGQENSLPESLFAVRFFLTNEKNEMEDTGNSFAIDRDTFDHLGFSYAKEHIVPTVNVKENDEHCIGKVAIYSHDMEDIENMGKIKVEIDLTRKVITTKNFCIKHKSEKDYKKYHKIIRKIDPSDFLVCDIDIENFAFNEVDDLQFFLMDPKLLAKSVPSFKILSDDSIFEVFTDI